MRPNNNIINWGSYAVPATTATVASTRSSLAQWANDIVRASFQVVITGSPNGGIKCQVSNDQAVGLPANQFQPINWNDNPDSPLIQITAAGVYLIKSFECSYQYLRLVYVDASGGTATGNITGRMESKGL